MISGGWRRSSAAWRTTPSISIPHCCCSKRVLVASRRLKPASTRQKRECGRSSTILPGNPARSDTNHWMDDDGSGALALLAEARELVDAELDRCADRLCADVRGVVGEALA